MKSILFLMITFSLFSGCNNGKEKIVNQSQATSDSFLDETGTLLADPITYDVVVKNPDPEDKWTNEQLENFNLDKLVKMVFSSIEKGKVTAFNYHTGEEMNLKEIKDLEKSDEFDRSKIGKVQFIEDWYFNEEKLIMSKKVKSIMFAYEVYDQFGKIRGYKAAFRIDLN